MCNNELLFKLLDSTKLIESSFTPIQAARFPELIKEAYFLVGKRALNVQALPDSKLAILSLGQYLFLGETRGNILLADINLFNNFLKFVIDHTEISFTDNSIYIKPEYISSEGGNNKLKEFFEANFDAKQLQLAHLVKDRYNIDASLSYSSKLSPLKKILSMVFKDKQAQVGAAGYTR